MRASHDFLNDSDIEFLRPIVKNDGLPNVKLYGIKNKENTILGFIGVSKLEIEMLFVDPNYFDQGIGSSLLRYAVRTLGLKKVGVNEQNLNALNFYQKMGFTVSSRSPLDGQGRPFPILYLTLSS